MPNGLFNTYLMAEQKKDSGESAQTVVDNFLIPDDKYDLISTSNGDDLVVSFSAYLNGIHFFESNKK